MGNPIIEIAVSQGDQTLGSIRLELYPDKAPGTVQNFLSLVDAGFYTGLIFHRVIRGFMGNDIRHTRGVISMARTSDPDSASSQFFIMQEDAPHLDAQYAAFGKVTEGMEIVDKIASCKTGRYGGYSDVPREPVIITEIKHL